jgi:hypothetical protein
VPDAPAMVTVAALAVALGRAAQALLQRGVRVHPSAVLLGPAGRCELGRGTVIVAEVRLDLGQTGRVVAGERV